MAVPKVISDSDFEDGGLKTSSGGTFRSDAAGAWQRMVADAAKEGINLRIEPGGSYRTRAQQAAAHKAKPNLVAAPGHSNHEKGIAVDVTDEGRDWVRKNGSRYGWNWGERKDEPWHFTYGNPRSLGRDSATTTRQGVGRPPKTISDADFQEPPKSISDSDFEDASKTPPISRPGVSPTHNTPQTKQAAKLLSRYEAVNRKIDSLQSEIDASRGAVFGAALGGASLPKAAQLKKLKEERDALRKHPLIAAKNLVDLGIMSTKWSAQDLEVKPAFDPLASSGYGFQTEDIEQSFNRAVQPKNYNEWRQRNYNAMASIPLVGKAVVGMGDWMVDIQDKFLAGEPKKAMESLSTGFFGTLKDADIEAALSPSSNMAWDDRVLTLVGALGTAAGMVAPVHGGLPAKKKALVEKVGAEAAEAIIKEAEGLATRADESAPPVSQVAEGPKVSTEPRPTSRDTTSKVSQEGGATPPASTRPVTIFRGGAEDGMWWTTDEAKAKQLADVEGKPFSSKVVSPKKPLIVKETGNIADENNVYDVAKKAGVDLSVADRTLKVADMFQAIKDAGYDFVIRTTANGRTDYIDLHGKPGAGMEPTAPPASTSSLMSGLDPIAAGHKLPEQSDALMREDWHKLNVKAAISEGKPVPPEVLADYPDLAKKYEGPKVSTEPSIKTKAQEPGASPGGSTTHAFKAASDRIATKIAELDATRKKSLGGNKQRGASNIGPEDFQLLALRAAKIAVDTAGNIELAIRSIAQEARLDKRQVALMRIRVHEIVAGEVGELPVQKLARMLRTAKESRKITDAARVAYRKEQAARVSGALDKGGVDAMYAALNELKGEQPLHKYESVFDAFSKDEVSAFMDAIRTRGDYAPQARAGLMRDFYDMMHGDTPTPYAIKHFERIFGPELTRALKSKWSFGKKMGVIFADIWNTPRAMMSSIDYSAPMRQAVIPTVSGLVSKRRAQTGAAFRDMVKAGYAEQYARVIHDSIVSDKNYSRLEDAGLYIADVFSENVHLLEREEAFMTSVAGKIPGIRGSERAFATYLNKSRIDYANYLIDAAERFGELTHDQVVQIANVTNILHGRGGGMGNFGKGLSAANSIIWSPRLLLARLQTLTPATYTSLPRGARLAVAKDLVRFTLAGATTLYLAKQLGYEVETDLRSSDALKIKDGNTRYDIWGGFQQLARYTMQFITAEYKDKEGNVRATGGPMEKQKGDRTSTVLRFAESKLSPSASYLWGWLRGTNFIGEDFDPKSELAQRMWSLALQDMKDVLDEEIARDGYSTEAILSGFAKGLPAVFGVGTQTYGEKEGKTKKESSTPSYKYKPANTGGSSTYQPLNTEKKNKE